MRGPRWVRAACLVLGLACSAGAQSTFPSDEKDPDRLRNLEYLLEQVNIVKSSITNNSGAAGGSSTLGSTQTWTGTNSYTVSASSPASTFSLNALTQKGLMSGAAVIAQAGADLLNSVNVTSITFQATGQLRINWAVAMRTTNYFCTCTADNVSPPLLCSINKIAPQLGLTTTTADFVISNLSGADTNANNVYVVCFGGAEVGGQK